MVCLLFNECSHPLNKDSVTGILSRVLCGHESIDIVKTTNAVFLLSSLVLNILAPLPIALKLLKSQRALAQSTDLGDTRKRISSTLRVIVVYMLTVVFPAVVVAIVEGVVKNIPEEVGVVFQCLIVSRLDPSQALLTEFAIVSGPRFVHLRRVHARVPGQFQTRESGSSH
jgi:hypothetical protein